MRRLSRHLFQQSLRVGVAIQQQGQQLTGDAGQALGQPGVLPGVAQAGLQARQQRRGMLAVLRGGGLFRRGKEQRRLLTRTVEEQGRVHLAQIAAMRAGHSMQRPGAEAFGQVRALDQVNDEPEVKWEGSGALVANKLQRLAK
ncbi:MAG: hypothetical protein BWY25_02749 [Chloroflexi bacterium ADurb.Bin222]|nr:MAG: hypothetical protein BWY25_02749 [Chloroflexi bacterium ADurb.Bin222]